MYLSSTYEAISAIDDLAVSFGERAAMAFSANSTVSNFLLGYRGIV